MKQLAFADGDVALQQYTELVRAQSNLPAFEKSTTRLDDYFFKELEIGKQRELAIVLKIVFTHGQSDFERGFNINKRTSKQNQSETSLIARRLVKDHMSENNEMPHTLVLSPKLRTAVKGARVQYEYAQEQERKAKAKAANEPLKQQLDDDIKKLKAKSKELKKIASDLANKATEKHEQAENSDQTQRLVREGNALK